MFQLAEMRDMVRVPCDKFNLYLEVAVSEELDRKLSNKVVPNVGLCICLHDILKLGESYNFPGDGSSHTQTTFRYIVFRPALDEIIIGRVKFSSPSGIQVSLGFFDAIFIKAADMRDGSYYDETDKVWIWKYEEHPLYMDVGHQLRMKVLYEVFQDTTPTGPQLAEENKASQGDQNKEKPAFKDPFTEVHPYSIYGSIFGAGLGLLEWWDAEEEEEEED